MLLYKPKGYLTTYRDPEGRPTVYDLVPEVGAWISPVGRLDLDTSGLLIMTNDTDFTERLTNPDHKVPKTYQIKASTLVTDELSGGDNSQMHHIQDILDRHAPEPTTTRKLQ